MKVRTLRKHQNAYGDTFVKNPRKQYDVPDAVGRNLVQMGLVEEVVDKPAEVEATGDDEV